jgi:hypothetical protein
LLTIIYRTVATGRIRRRSKRTIILATVAGYLVAVITLIITVDYPVTADRQGTCVGAAVTIVVVAIVALITAVDNGVTTDGQGTCVRTPIVVHLVAVVTGFSGIEDAIATNWQLTISLTSVAIYSITVVTLLTGIYIAVTAGRFCCTVGVIPVVKVIAVVIRTKHAEYSIIARIDAKGCIARTRDVLADRGEVGRIGIWVTAGACGRNFIDPMMLAKPGPAPRA